MMQQYVNKISINLPNQPLNWINSTKAKVATTKYFFYIIALKFVFISLKSEVLLFFLYFGFENIYSMRESFSF